VAALATAVIVAAAVGVIAALSRGDADSQATRQVTRGATTTPQAFYVVGTHIVAPDGTNFYPVGANVGMHSNFDWRGTAEGHAADAVDWGWNTVRLTFTCTDAYSFTIRKSEGYDSLVARVDQVVEEYTAQHIVVILECHDALVDQAQVEQFWLDAAHRYKDNPYVWFNPLNEPTWNDNAAWLAIQQRYLALIRSTGAENVFVADVQNAGNDAGWDGALRVYDDGMGPALEQGQCNVVFSQHEYGGVDDNIGAAEYWDRVQAKGLAMLVGEFGYTINGTSTAGSYAQNLAGANSVFTEAPKLGIGALWWHATHGDNYSLKLDGGAFYEGGADVGLSPGGQQLWELSHNKPDLGRFDGELSASNCPSTK
jgi:mannan endo-1,4-beta-mannosidase